MFKHSTKKPVRYKSLKSLGFPNYSVGDDGSVWRYVKSRDLWKELKLLNHRDGYVQVRLYSGMRQSKYFQVHRLVLHAFVGPCPEGMEACHYPDADKTNNCLENLRWDTRRQNSQDKVLQGLSNHGKHYNQGEDHAKAKLTEGQVIEIRESFSNGQYNQVQLASKYGVSSGIVSGIVRGVYWPHVGGPRCKKKLSDSEVREIRVLFAAGNYNQAELARRFKVHPSTISLTVRYKCKR